MAVVFRSKSETVTTSSSNPNPGEPAGAASGDFLIALALIDSAAASIASPGGWADLDSGASSSPKFRWRVSYVVRGGSAPSYTWTKSAGSFYYEVYVLALRSDAGQSLALDAQSSSGATGNANNATHVIDPPAVTAVASASLAVAMGINWLGAAAGGWTAPSGYTIRAGTGTGDDGAMATKALSAAGSENPGVFSNCLAGTDNYWDGFTITVKESAAATKAPPPWRRPRRWFRTMGGILLPAAMTGPLLPAGVV